MIDAVRASPARGDSRVHPVRARRVVRRGGASSAGLAAMAVLSGLGAMVPAGCQPNVTELDIDVVTPEDAGELEAANNVAMVLEPNGASLSAAADGLDFDLALELDPDHAVRTLALYLARDERLLAWGRTAPFTLGAAADGIAVFLGQPGALSTFPLVLDVPDDLLLAAAAPGRGVVTMSTSGATSYLDGFTLVTRAAAPLPDPPAADDGVLVGDANGGVMRVAFAQGLRAHRFDPGDDAWIDVTHTGAAAVGLRPEAAWVVDIDGRVLSLFGGGDHTDVVAIDLTPRDDGSLAAGVVQGLALDAPRRGASALWATGDDDEIVIFGGDDVPALYLVRRGAAVGPSGAWLGGRCVRLDDGDDTIRVLCGGGVRDGAPTGDAVIVSLTAGAEPSLEERAALLTPPMPSPRWFVDDSAVYAQGEGVLLPLDRVSLTPDEPRNGLRARGGQVVALEGGATLLVGGSDANGVPTTRMQVFTPAVTAD